MSLKAGQTLLAGPLAGRLAAEEPVEAERAADAPQKILVARNEESGTGRMLAVLKPDAMIAMVVRHDGVQAVDGRSAEGRCKRIRKRSRAKPLRRGGDYDSGRKELWSPYGRSGEGGDSRVGWETVTPSGGTGGRLPPPSPPCRKRFPPSSSCSPRGSYGCGAGTRTKRHRGRAGSAVPHSAATANPAMTPFSKSSPPVLAFGTIRVLAEPEHRQAR